MSRLWQLSLLGSCLAASSTAPRSCPTSVRPSTSSSRQLLSAGSGCAGLMGCHCLLLCSLWHRGRLQLQTLLFINQCEAPDSGTCCICGLIGLHKARQAGQQRQKVLLQELQGGAQLQARATCNIQESCLC